MMPFSEHRAVTWRSMHLKRFGLKCSEMWLGFIHPRALGFSIQSDLCCKDLYSIFHLAYGEWRALLCALDDNIAPLSHILYASRINIYELQYWIETVRPQYRNIGVWWTRGAASLQSPSGLLYIWITTLASSPLLFSQHHEWMEQSRRGGGGGGGGGGMKKVSKRSKEFPEIWPQHHVWSFAQNPDLY